jgi:hypothetical protein
MSVHGLVVVGDIPHAVLAEICKAEDHGHQFEPAVNADFDGEADFSEVLAES